MGPYGAQSDPQEAAADEAARLARVRERKKLADRNDQRDDEEAQTDLLMAVGGIHQWDPAAAKERARLGRPLYTANRFVAMLAQITGEVRANPPAISCAPADSDATQAASDVLEGVIRSIERLSQGQQIYAETVEAAATCGRGHLRIVPVYADDEGFDVELRLRAIRNVLSVKWDPSAQEFDKGDANWCIVVSELDKKSFEEAYPDVGNNAWAAAKIASRQLDGWHSGSSDKVTVAEEWEVKREPYQRYRVAHTKQSYGGAGGIEVIPPTGHEAEIDGDAGGATIDSIENTQWLAAAEQAGWEVVQSRTAYRRTVCMYLWGGDKQIAGPIEWKGNRIPVFTVPGRQTHVDGQTVHAGIVRHARDAQRLHNWARSTDFEAVSLSAKSTPIVEESQIEGFEDEWELARKAPRSYKRYKHQNGVPAPRDPDPINANPGPNSLAEAGIRDMEDATGIHGASLGKRSNETSGVAIDARDAQTDTGTFVFIYNLRLIVESVGRELVSAIPHYYSTRKQIMILGQDDAPAIVELSKIRLDLGKYHVIAKTGPAYATKREKSAELLMEMAKAAEPFARFPIYKRVIRFLDTPDADELIAEMEAIGRAVGALPPMNGAAPPGMPQPGAPGPVEGVPGAPPSNVVRMPPRGAPPMPGPGADPLAGLSVSPPGVPAVRPRVGNGQMPAVPPGM